MGREDDDYGDGAAWIRGPLLGKGTFGRVYKATTKTTNNNRTSVMAVKSAEVSVSETLRREKEMMSNLKGSPYVITCFGDETTVGEGGVKAYNLLLEYASGGTLSDRINNSSSSGLAEAEVRAHAESILRGVSHIHNLGYVHCDLKPDNILLVPTIGDHGRADELFRAKIGDFGLAKRGKQANNNKKRKLDEPPSCRPRWRGTPMYLSPEAVMENVQEAECDVWAVGCIVLKMLTGKAPWEGRNILKRIGTGLESPKIPKENISEGARHFLMCCFERNPVYRLTADLLLEHPWITGVNEDDDVLQQEDLINDLDHELIIRCGLFSDTNNISDCSWSEEVDGDESSDDEEIAVRKVCSERVWQRRNNVINLGNNNNNMNAMMRLVGRCY